MTVGKYRRPTGSTPSPVRDAIIKVLKDHGPMTAREVANFLPEFSEEKIVRNIHITRAAYPGAFFRVTRYIDPIKIGSKCKHFLSVYAAIPGPDAPKPDLDRKARRKETIARYNERHAAQVKVSKAKWNAKRPGTRKKTDYNPWQGLGAR